MRQVISRLSWTAKLSISLGLLLIVGWIDLVTGWQTSLAIFYGLPIGVAVALCGRRTALVISGLAALTWFWADVAAGHPYPNRTGQALESSLRVSFFFLIAVAGAALKARHEAMAARIKLLEDNRRLEQQIIHVSEHEQKRIGHDLHDGLCQYFAALACSTSSLRRDLERKSLADFATAAGELSQQINDGVIQIRNLARGLTPVQTAEGGLVSALEELAESVSRLQGVDCTFECVGVDNCEKGLRATHLFRIAQQAVHNAIKHGRARHIDVRMTCNGQATALSVADDGIGMPETNHSSSGMGVDIMRYRAAIIAGELIIENRPLGGTVISCSSPNKLRSNSFPG